MIKHATKKTTPEYAVLVTTVHKGVFFGYTHDYSGETIHLRSARMCIYWSANLRGVIGLASHGPDDNCRISPAADMELRGISAVMMATPTAVERWELAPWKI